MLDPHQLELYCARHNLSLAAINHINYIRESPPSRRVKPRVSVTTLYPSRKMGHSVQAESHRVELPGVLLYEFATHVYEFWDQPPSYKISYMGSNGRRKTYMVTQDFFVLEESGIYWDEWKEEEKLIELAEKEPNYIFKDSDGRWRSPPNEEYAAQYGFTHRIRSSAEINWNIISNIDYYKDYWFAECPPVPEDAVEHITQLIYENPGIRLNDFLKLTNEFVPSDYVHKLIADQELYMDLSIYRGSDPKHAYVFIDKATHDAYQATLETSEDPFEINYVDLKPGASVIWDGTPGTILNCGLTAVDIQLSGGSEEAGSQLIPLPNGSIKSFVRTGRLSGDGILHDAESQKQTALEIINSASPTALKKALKRYDIVKPIIDGLATADDFDTPNRTIRRWVRWYKEGIQLYNSGFAGLIRNEDRKGNREPRYNKKVEDFANEIIKTLYETPTGRTQKNVYNTYKRRCKQTGIPWVGRDKFYELIQNRAGPKQDNQRSGKRAAQSNAPWYWYLGYRTPVHGERIFHIVHKDHTQLDILLVDSETGKPLGKPWLTIIMDAFSRRVLAIYLTFDAPSNTTFMMAMRTLVKRYGRFPDYLVVDGGKDFSSIYTESLLATFECAKKTRPGPPRYGNVIERLFK